jgi:hypothetical protein
MKRLLVGLLSGVTLLGAIMGVSFAISNNKTVMTNATTSSWDGSSRTAYTSAALTYNGTAYYPIRTAAELAYIATDSSSWSKNFILMNDIDLASKSWTPIALNNFTGSDDPRAFSGTFDGNGHTISNLSIQGAYGYSGNSGVKYSEVGFFGVLTGTVKNLSFNVVSFNAWSNASLFYIGPVAGHNKGTINHVSVKGVSGTIISSYLTGTYSTGSCLAGFVGYNSGTITNSLLFNGSLSVSIENYHWYIPAQKYYAGSFTAYNDGSISNVYCSFTLSASNNKAGYSSSNYSDLATAVNSINATSLAKASYTSGGIYNNNLTPFIASTGLATSNAAALAEETNATFLATKTCDPTNAYNEAVAYKAKYDSDPYLQDVATNTTYTKDDNGIDVTAYNAVTKMNYILTKYAPSKASGLGLFATTNEESSFATIMVVLSLSLLLAAPFLYKHLKRQ